MTDEDDEWRMNDDSPFTSFRPSSSSVIFVSLHLRLPERSMAVRWLSRLKREPIRPEDYVGSNESANEQIVREGFLAKAKRYLNRLPLAQETVAMYFCLLDPRTPLWVKATVAAALAY